MKTRKLSVTLALTLALCPLAVVAADGLVAPAATELWPQWQARIALQTATVSPVSLSRVMDGGGSAAQTWQGGALLGDYYFATPSFGSFRASGGLMFGATGGAPLLSAAAGSRVELALQGSGAGLGGAAEGAGTVPYLGLGFTSAAWRDSLSLTADLGWVAGQPSAAGSVGRAIFGNQGRENAWRELRVSPVLQVGLRYRF